MQVVDATALRQLTLWFLATTGGRYESYDLLLKLIIRKLSTGYARMKGRWQKIAKRRDASQLIKYYPSW